MRRSPSFGAHGSVGRRPLAIAGLEWVPISSFAKPTLCSPCGSSLDGWVCGMQQSEGMHAPNFKTGNVASRINSKAMISLIEHTATLAAQLDRSSWLVVACGAGVQAELPGAADRIHHVESRLGFVV